jgi:hypothetical protein
MRGNSKDKSWEDFKQWTEKFDQTTINVRIMRPNRWILKIMEFQNQNENKKQESPTTTLYSKFNIPTKHNQKSEFDIDNYITINQVNRNYITINQVNRKNMKYETELLAVFWKEWWSNNFDDAKIWNCVRIRLNFDFWLIFYFGSVGYGIF